MTRFERKNAGSGHRYTLDGFEIPGVTTHKQEVDARRRNP